jgi:hypothetical protein
MQLWKQDTVGVEKLTGQNKDLVLYLTLRE